MKVDDRKCIQIAAHLTQLGLPTDSEEATEAADLDPLLLADYYWVLVAVCHQTSVPPVGLRGTVGGQTLIGWDYLREAFARATRDDPEWLRPESLARIGERQLDAIVRAPDNSATLVGLSERAMLLREMGQWMVARGSVSVEDLFRESGGVVDASSPYGLLRALAKVKAYSDPVRKKSYFFLSLMQNHRVWKFVDPGNIGPPVDYHEVRGHLRCGSVRLLDPSLELLLHSGQSVTGRVDIEIRTAVHDAIMRIAHHSGYSPSQLHYYFWNLFRSCCRGQATHCESCISCQLPERYAVLARSDSEVRCSLASCCESRSLPGKVNEHLFSTHYY